MKIKIVILLLLISVPCFGDIAGSVSIGKDNDTARGNIKIGYDFTYKDFILIPFIDYTNYFRVESYSGYPFKDIFGVGVKLSGQMGGQDGGQVYLMIKHECIHAVSSINSRGEPVLYGDAEANASSTYITVGYRWGKSF